MIEIPIGRGVSNSVALAGCRGWLSMGIRHGLPFGSGVRTKVDCSCGSAQGESPRGDATRGRCACVRVCRRVGRPDRKRGSGWPDHSPRESCRGDPRCRASGGSVSRRPGSRLREASGRATGPPTPSVGRRVRASHRTLGSRRPVSAGFPSPGAQHRVAGRSSRKRSGPQCLV